MAAPKKKPAGPPSQFNKGLFKVFFWTLGTIVFLVLLLIGIAAFYEKGIGNLVVQELKKALKTDLQVESAQLSLVWDFPRASVTLKNVKLRGIGGDTSQYLLKAEGISLKCGMFGLLAGSYTFNRIEINNATLYVRHDKNGKANYDVFKSSSDSTSKDEKPSKLDLSIENATLNNVSLQYVDDKLHQDLKLKVSTAFFSGKFTNERYDMTSYANIVSEHVKIDKDVYLKNKELGYDAVIDIDNKTNTYTFKKVDVTVEGNRFASAGKVAQLKEGTDMDISFKTDKARLNSLIRLFPRSFQKSLGGFESNAHLNFDAKLKGVYSDKSLPKIDIKFGLKNGRLSHPKMASEIKGVRFDIEFAHEGGRSRKNGSFELKNFKGTLGGNPIEIKLKMEGLDNPKIDFAFNGTIPLKSMFGLLGEDISKGQGEVKVDELFLKGNLNDMIDPRRISRVELGGTVNFVDAGIVLNEVPMVFKEGTFQLKDNIFNITNLAFKTPKSDITLEGNFQNVLPVLFSDSLNSQHAEMGFRALLKSDKIDADELIAAFTSKSAAPEKTEKSAEEVKDSLVQAQNEKRAFLTQFLHGIFKADVGEITYGKIVVKNFKGELAFENNVLKLMGLRLDAMKGSMGLNAKVVFEKEPYLLAFLECNKVDINEFLVQTDNFGQETITSENLRGELTSIVKINAFWDAQGNFSDKDLVVIADIKLRNGELIGFDMLEDFGKFVKLEDLRHIRFSELNNQFIIQNRMVHLPAMFIQSNALNLTISGKHSFDQDIDYKFKINAGQVIAQKMKKHNPDLVPIPAKQKGIFNIYAMVTGNVTKEEYKFKMGKKNVKKQLDAELGRELTLVTNTLKSEFEKSDLFTGHGVSVRAEDAAAKVTTLKEPKEWDDIPEFNEGKDNPDEYIEGF